MRKRQFLALGIAALLSAAVVVGCADNAKSGAPVKTQYIGDNSAVSQIADSLPYPEGVSFNSLEIQSAKEPYELKVYLNTSKAEAPDLQQCADDAFNRIANMGKISFFNEKNGDLIKSFDRK